MVVVMVVGVLPKLLQQELQTLVVEEVEVEIIHLVHILELNGGSGVVILRVNTTAYSGTTSGSPTVTTDGDFTVIKFTGNGSYTS